MNRVVPTTALLLTLLGGPGTAIAQSSGAYLGGAFTVAPWRPQPVSGGSPSTTYANTSTETLALGAIGEAGWYFNASAGVGVEIGLPLQRRSLTQPFGYFTPYLRETQYREQTIMGVLRARMTAGRARVALVAGGGFVRGSSLDRYARGTFGSPEPGPFGERSEERHTTMALTVGTDVEMGATQTLMIVPQFRLFIVDRGNVRDSEPAFADLGLATILYRAGIGVRVVF